MKMRLKMKNRSHIYNINEQVMKKLSNTEAKLKKALLIKRQVVLNCRRLSYIRSFTRDIITQNTTHSKKYIFIGAISQVRHLGSGRE